MTSNKDGDGANGFPHGFNVVHFPKVDSVSSNDMETEENAEPEHDIQVVPVAQDFELLNLQGEPIENVQNGSIEISEEIIIPDMIVNVADVRCDEPTIFSAGHPISDIENGNYARSTEDENVAAPPTWDISDGTEDIQIGSIDESDEGDQQPNSSDFSPEEIVARFKPHILNNGQFVPNYEGRRKWMAAVTFSPQKIVQNPGLEILPIIEEREGSLRKHTCQLCGHAFLQPHQWKRHARIHTGQVVFKCTCPRCGVPYRDYRTARRHHNAAYPH